MKWRLIFLSVSGLALALLGLVCLDGMGSFEQHVLESARSLLEGSGRTIEAELSLRGRVLAELSEQLAADPDLPDALRSPGAEADRRIKQFRGARQELDGITLVKEDGIVVATNARRFHVGDSLVTGKDDGSNAAAPLKAAAPGHPGLMDAVLSGYPSRGVSMVDGGVYHWGAAPIYVKGVVIGAVLMERWLQALPAAPGTEAFLVVDGKVAVGKARDGWRDFVTKGPDTPFLMHATETKVVVPLLGAIRKQPMFVGSNQVGIWAQRFQVPGSTAPVGFVAIDLTPQYSELAGFQLMFVILVLFVWLAHGALIFNASRLSPAGPDELEESPVELLKVSLLRLYGLAREQLGKGLVVLRKRLDSRKNPQPDQGPDTNAGTIVVPLGVEGEAENDVKLDDRTPPLAERMRAKLAALEDVPEPTGDVVGPSTFDEDATSAMQMTPELMAELDAGKPEKEAPQETQVMNVTAELLADMKAGLVEAKAAEPENPLHRELYGQFMTMRKVCGESDEFSFEKFKLMLDGIQSSAMADHKCTAVRFHILVQAGKAVLTAAPAPEPKAEPEPEPDPDPDPDPELPPLAS